MAEGDCAMVWAMALTCVLWFRRRIARLEAIVADHRLQKHAARARIILHLAGRLDVAGGHAAPG